MTVEEQAFRDAAKATASAINSELIIVQNALAIMASGAAPDISVRLMRMAQEATARCTQTTATLLAYGVDPALAKAATV